ncbi:LamG-like jellyroll fold domain-containing protein [uncultured Microbacterium sp.]|uniref:LamG-like jellyroll fold domain-containing protein n=1 Tax=uncultured Microbacterium sp. TaxID=191216 RepID=UPI0028D31FEE|nr:LamG-like jellyroll fold domain-containing protein [uncultured Microbacterium sp.]
MRSSPRLASCKPIAALTAGLAVAVLAIGQPAAAESAQATPAAASAADHLILDYDFEGTSSPSATVQDVSGDGRNGTLANPGSAKLVDRQGGGKALQLSGGARTSTTAPYITVPSGLFKDLQGATISSWVKWEGDEVFEWLYTLGKDRTSATFYTPKFEDGTARSSAKPTSTGQEVGARAATALPTDGWHLITTTVDQNALIYYLDGLEVSRTATGIDVAQALYGASSPNSGYIGQPFWTGAHPFFQGSIDDFQVYDTVLSPQQVRDLAGTSAPALTEVLETSTQVRTDVGTAPSLPGVRATYGDGQERLAPVTWDAVPATAYAQRGSFTVEGVVDGTTTAVTASVKVVSPGELSIDAADRTGAFMGGASGTLYGLYGPGLPSNNLIDGIQLRTVSTKAQDGPQHPGADALEVVKPIADSSDGDVYIYMTDVNRGFPYEVPGSTGAEKEAWYKQSIIDQVRQVKQLPAEYQDNIVFVPYNEPEGNMYGDGPQAFWGQSWLNSPDRFFAAWDDAYRSIKAELPDARIAGPNTSVLFNQVYGFMEHAIANDTVPDVVTWHELSDPATIRSSVARYRAWEQDFFAGTKWEGTELPINLNEYAFNYHTSVPAQMIQWISAIEDTKVDGDIAYWNIDGNLSDSAVEANRGNGQWWLLNSYGNMTGDTVRVTPPQPDVSYTLQGVATIDDAKQQVKALIGGSSGPQKVFIDNLPSYVGGNAHVLIRDIRWTGQIGDSAEPQTVKEFEAPVRNGSVELSFGQGDLPALGTDSAYEIVVTPGADTTSPSQPAVSWRGVYEAESAPHTGAPYYNNGPEGSPADVGKFYTSGERNVGGIETNSNLALNFEVDVPQAGTYDLSVLANAYNKESRNEAQGPVNMFLRVNGAAEQEVYADLGYKWVVWDHTDTKVALNAGENTITLAARSLDGTKATTGAAIIDKIDVTLPNAAYTPIYEAENAVLHDATAAYDRGGVSGSGYVDVGANQSATFWVYNKDDSEKTLEVKTLGGGTGKVRVNGVDLGEVTDTAGIPAFLVGGVNKVEIVGGTGTLAVDRIAVGASGGKLASQTIEAEAGVLAGTAKVQDLSLASGGKAVVGIGGAQNNANTLTHKVTVAEAGTYAMTVRYSNEEQSPASHYNPDPVARRADVSVNGGAVQQVLFPQSYSANQFWELTVPVQLKAGENTVSFASKEAPDFNGTTFISERFPTLGLRSQWAPNMDKLTFTAMKPAAAVPAVKMDATASTRKIGGKAYVTVTAVNRSAVPVQVDIVTAYGKKSFASVQPGQTVSAAIGSGKATIPAGKATVTATATIDGKKTTSTVEALYNAQN